MKDDPRLSWLRPEDYGAKGDGADDAGAIQAALDEAGRTGIPEVLLGQSISYAVASSLAIPTNVTLRCTSGTTLKAIGPWFSPMIKMWGVTNAGLTGCTLDGDAVARGLGPTDPPSDGIQITTSSYCAAESNRIVNVGRPSDPGGTAILVEAWEEGETMIDRTQYWPQLKPRGPSRFNRVARNVVEDPDELLYFPIRLLTIWYHPASYTYLSPVEYNVVTDNIVVGGNWNGIEVAGPATRYNEISFNVARDTHQSGIESDKGASFNSFLWNIVDGVTFKKPGSLTSDLSAGGMRAQGYNDASYTWRAKGNVFRGNTIRNVRGGPSPATGHGMLIFWADDTLFEDNTVELISREGDERGQAIVLYSWSDRTVVRGNVISGVHYGVMPWSNNSGTADSAIIDANVISASKVGICTTLSPTYGGSARNWIIRDNVVRGEGDAASVGYAIRADAVASDRALIQGNRVEDWFIGITLRAPGSAVRDNYVTGGTHLGIVVQANSDASSIVQDNTVQMVSDTPYRFDVATLNTGNVVIPQP